MCMSATVCLRVKGFERKDVFGKYRHEILFIAVFFFFTRSVETYGMEFFKERAQVTW